MSEAKINPFHIKILTITLRCYITYESLREGWGSPWCPGWVPALARLTVMGFSEGQSSGKLWTGNFYPTPQRLSILCSGKGVSSWHNLNSFFQILKWNQKEKEEKLESHFKEQECFYFAVISLSRPGGQIVTPGFNQQAPGDSNVN